MKILIAADLHIGANKFGVSDEKWSQPFAELVDYAIDNKMDAVAFAGDVFHHRRPTTWTSRFVAHQIQRLVSAEIYVLGADGNHDDGVSTDSVSAAWHLPKISQSEVIWASKRILSYTIGDVNIVLLPWVTPQAYDIATDLPLKEQLEAAQSEALRELSMLDETRTNILIGHAMVAYGKGEDDLAPSPGLQWAGKDVVFDYNTLAKGFDAVFLGHVHDPESLGYVGSSQPTDWGDAGQVKSFQVIDTDYMRTRYTVPYKTSLRLLDIKEDESTGLAFHSLISGALDFKYDIGRYSFHEVAGKPLSVEELAGIKVRMEAVCDVVESITVTKDRTIVQRVREDIELATMKPADALEVWLKQSSTDVKTSKGVRSKFNSLLEANSKE